MKRWSILLRGIQADEQEARTVAHALHQVCRELGHPEVEHVSVEAWLYDEATRIRTQRRTWEAEHAASPTQFGRRRRGRGSEPRA